MAGRILAASENRSFLLQKVEYTVDSNWMSIAVNLATIKRIMASFLQRILNGENI